MDSAARLAAKAPPGYGLEAPFSFNHQLKDKTMNDQEWREQQSWLNSMRQPCPRCGGNMNASTMSKFNQQTICMACKADERLAPGYAAADKAECDAVRAGDRNFPGVGLSAEDQEFLARKRDERKAAAVKS